jgi:yecA family protein
VWGPEEKDTPRFRNEEQADRILALIVRQLNGVLRTLQLDIDNYTPIVDVVEHEGEDYDDAEMWAFGFMAGINLARTAWQPVFEQPEVLETLKPVFLLSAKNLTEEQKTPGRDAATARRPGGAIAGDGGCAVQVLAALPQSRGAGAAAGRVQGRAQRPLSLRQREKV